MEKVSPELFIDMTPEEEEEIREVMESEREILEELIAIPPEAYEEVLLDEYFEEEDIWYTVIPQKDKEINGE
ncbi:MAG: hypothetical protein QXT14_08935 [Candidatus Bathyarchaeia archaeon]